MSAAVAEGNCMEFSTRIFFISKYISRYMCYVHTLDKNKTRELG